jgi:hypothetical protein
LPVNTIHIIGAVMKKTLDIYYTVVVKYNTMMLTLAFEIGAAKHRGRSEEAQHKSNLKFEIGNSKLETLDSALEIRPALASSYARGNPDVKLKKLKGE